MGLPLSRVLQHMEIPLLLAVPAVMAAALLAGIEQRRLPCLSWWRWCLRCSLRVTRRRGRACARLCPHWFWRRWPRRGASCLAPFPTLNRERHCHYRGCDAWSPQWFYGWRVGSADQQFLFWAGHVDAVADVCLGSGGLYRWRTGACGAFGRADGTVRMPALLAYGFASGLLYGVVINAYDIIGFVQPLTWAGAIARLATAVPFDITHGLATCVFLAALYKPGVAASTASS